MRFLFLSTRIISHLADGGDWRLADELLWEINCFLCRLIMSAGWKDALIKWIYTKIGASHTIIITTKRRMGENQTRHVVRPELIPSYIFLTRNALAPHTNLYSRIERGAFFGIMRPRRHFSNVWRRSLIVGIDPRVSRYLITLSHILIEDFNFNKSQRQRLRKLKFY